LNDITTPHCPLPNIGPCVGERCNFWDPEEGCVGTGICFESDPSIEPIGFSDDENPQ